MNKNLEIRIFGHERIFCYPRYTEFQCKKYDVTYALRVYVIIELLHKIKITSSVAYFGEIHPAIIKKLDFKEPNIYGLEIFLKNISEPNKKTRFTKKKLSHFTLPKI